jgi:hypothetical protein
MFDINVSLEGSSWVMDGKLALHRTHQAPFIKPFDKGVNMQGLFLKNQFPAEAAKLSKLRKSFADRGDLLDEG